jgi:putative ABC transport system permease protein
MAHLDHQLIINSQVVNRIKSLPFVQETLPVYRGQLSLNAHGNTQNVPVVAMDPSKISLILPNVQLVPGSEIKPTDSTAMVVGNTVANPPGPEVPFLTVGQTVKAIYTYSNGVSGKAATQSKTFVVSATMEVSGNNYVGQSVFINQIVGNELFHKARKFDGITVAAKSPYNKTFFYAIMELGSPPFPDIIFL